MTEVPGPPSAAGPSDTETSAPVGPAAPELARARAEADVAASAPREPSPRELRGGVGRRLLVGLLVLLFALLVPITVASTWAHRTLLNTDHYVSTVAPLAEDPAVQAALARTVTDQLYATLDPQAIIQDALPPRAAFLAGPIALGAKDAVRDAVARVLAGDRFHQLWANANRYAHAQLVTVLRDKSSVLLTSNGQVVLNLAPLVNEAIKQTMQLVSGIVGKTVALPSVTASDVPSDVCKQISSALDRPVPDTCGQIALFPAKDLTEARRLVRAFDRGVVALLVVTPLVGIAALAISRRRRRTLLQLTLGAALLLVVLRRVMFWEQDQLVATGRPENKAARSAIVHSVLNGFFDVTLFFLVAALVIAAVALVAGPYRWATATRRWVATAGTRVWHLARAGVTGEAPADDPAIAWAWRNFDVLRVGAVVVAALLLLVIDLNPWGVLAVLVVLALFEAWLHRVRPPKTLARPPEPAGTRSP